MALPRLVRMLGVAAAVGGVLAAAACASRAAWTPVTPNGRLPVEVDRSRIRPVQDGAIEVWSRESYPYLGPNGVRERRMGVHLNCETREFRLVDVYLLSRNGKRYRDSVTAGAFVDRTPEREAARPWIGAYRLPFRADEVCAQWGSVEEAPPG